MSAAGHKFAQVAASTMQAVGFQDDANLNSKTLGLKNECLKSRSPYVCINFYILITVRSQSLNYLLQVRSHANNPVNWQLWNPETLALAKKHDKMLFVSIGYAACHCKWDSDGNLFKGWANMGV